MHINIIFSEHAIHFCTLLQWQFPSLHEQTQLLVNLEDKSFLGDSSYKLVRL